MFICLRRTPLRSGFFVRPKGKCHFLCLETKKVTKESSRLKIILGLLFFSLPTQYNSLSTFRWIAQTVLLTLFLRSKLQNSRFPFNLAPSLKLPTGQFFNARPSQNYLRPAEIQKTKYKHIFFETAWRQTGNGAKF